MQTDTRKEQLEQLAAEDNEDAIGDLYREFGVDFGRDSK
jgi:hypothetical protein